MLRATREFEVGNGWHLGERIMTGGVRSGTSLDMFFMEHTCVIVTGRQAVWLNEPPDVMLRVCY